MTITVKPGPGRRVRNPTTGLLISDETEVPRTQYWLRRLRDGDVVEVKAKTTKSSRRTSHVD